MEQFVQHWRVGRAAPLDAHLFLQEHLGLLLGGWAAVFVARHKAQDWDRLCRLLLGDALTRAGEESPDLVIDFATLTGAARSALGPDLPALFARRDETGSALLSAGLEHDDPCWRLPLHDAYREWLKSDIADIMNSHANAYAGASVAALFLDRFVPEGVDWAHFDTFAWRPFTKPGRPKGGDALGLRAAWHMLKQRYA